MDKFQRQIQIRYPGFPGENNYHTVLVYRADLTADGRIVISYYDITDGYADSFSEIVNVGGEWRKNPNHLQWSDYVFVDFDPAFNNSIIGALGDKVELANFSKDNNTELPEKQSEERPIAIAQSEVLDPPEQEVETIRIVCFANEGEDVINLNPTSYESEFLTQQDYSLETGTAFFSKGFLDKEMTEHFYSVKIEKNDMKDILNYIRSLGRHGRINISECRNFTVRTRSNTVYDIYLSSCSKWGLFWHTKIANSLSVDESSVVDSTFPDYLSSALHYELPLDIVFDGHYYSNGVKKKGKTL